MPNHFMVDGEYSRVLSCVWEEQDGFGDEVKSFYPTVRLVADVCHVGFPFSIIRWRESKYSDGSLSKARSITRDDVRGYSEGKKKCIQVRFVSFSPLR